MWILCSRFERRVQGVVTAYGCLGDGKCPLPPATAAVLRADGTGGPRRPGTDRRHPVLVFTAPFAQADAEDDLDRVVAVHPRSCAPTRPPPEPTQTCPGRTGCPSGRFTCPCGALLTSRPTPPKEAGQARDGAARADRTAPSERQGGPGGHPGLGNPRRDQPREERRGSASHLARRHPRPTRRAAYAAVDTVRQPLTWIGSRESRPTGPAQAAAIPAPPPPPPPLPDASANQPLARPATTIPRTRQRPPSHR